MGLKLSDTAELRGLVQTLLVLIFINNLGKEEMLIDDEAPPATYKWGTAQLCACGRCKQ